jgi:DNA-binding NtrC family response regulator
VRGAFTGAEKEREGAFVQADGGTVFLDEVGELPLDLQPMLLRVLEQGEVQPLGGSTARKVDVRVVSASHRDLRRLVADRTFREDLFFRLSGVTVEVPSLATRGEDILLLAAAFLEPGFELTEAARKRLLEYPWPGNVRELQHVVKRAMALTRSNLVGPEDLFPGGALGDVAQEKPKSAAEEPPETVALREVLERNRWNRKETARELGCDRTTLWRMMKRAGLL